MADDPDDPVEDEPDVEDGGFRMRGGILNLAQMGYGAEKKIS